MPEHYQPPVEGSQSQEVITPEMWSTYRWARNEWCYGPDRTGVDREAFAIAAMLNTIDLPRLRAENERLREALTAIRGPIKLGLDLDYVRTAAVIDVALGGSQAKGSE